MYLTDRVLTYKKIVLILISGLLLFSFQDRKEKVTRLNEPAISKKIDTIIPHFVVFNDTIPSDTLFEYLSENQMPVMYSRKIHTGVCIDGECRMVFIELYWNITGRYLGFKMPKGEFLSKTEHVRFSPDEYDKLHHLLAVPSSALANYSLKELVPEKDSTEVDAVSSATIAAVLDYIVEGAVYTTYTLWHIVYGPTKREIEKISSEKLTPEIAFELLNSNNLEDQVWTLKHIPGEVRISRELHNKLLELISSNDIYLAERSLNALKAGDLTSEAQKELVTFLQKRLIIKKLKDAPQLDNYVVEKFSDELNNLNGVLVKTTLEMFEIHKLKDEIVVANVAKLFKNENRYIANQAFTYLENQDNLNVKILRSIEKYKKNNF